MSALEYALLKSTVGVVACLALAYYGHEIIGLVIFFMMLTWTERRDKCGCDAANGSEPK